jgi:hypothetical protein
MWLVCERSVIEGSQSNISHCISVISNALMKTYADADLWYYDPIPQVQLHQTPPNAHIHYNHTILYRSQHDSLIGTVNMSATR